MEEPMPATPFDSLIYRDLLGDPDLARLFSDSGEVRAMMLVEGTLALVQGRAGLIPETAGVFLHRAAMELQIDAAALSVATAQSAVPVPALVTAFRQAAKAPDHARYLHWGATSQDIMETGLVLRLRQALVLIEARLRALTKALGQSAADHGNTPMAARTYGQIATPTTYGAVVAAWGAPLLRHLQRLGDLRPRLLVVSLSGAAGTLSAMGPQGPAIRAALAKELDLADPGGNWHAQRDRICELAGWLALVLGSLGKIAEDMLAMTQSGIGELRLAQGGGSSTMPQKVNPVLPSLVVALARHGIGLNATLQGAALHRQNRDGAAWMTEWLTLPQLLLSTGRSLSACLTLADSVQPDPARMAALLDDGSGLIHAEALSFALARLMPRPEAQAAVAALCQDLARSGGHLLEAAGARWPGLDLRSVTDPGEAPAEAQAFAAAAAAL